MICRICSRDFDIPANAVLLKRKFGIALYLFPGPNGQVHEFRLQQYRNTKPSPTAVPTGAPEPVEQTELLETVIEALAELPEPRPKLPEPEPIEPDFEQPEPEFNAMAAAFRKFK